MNDEQRAALRAFLEAEPIIERIGRRIFKLDERQVDFSQAMPTPMPARGLRAIASAILGWMGNQAWALRLMDWLGKRELEKMKREV